VIGLYSIIDHLGHSEGSAGSVELLQWIEYSSREFTGFFPSLSKRKCSCIGPVGSPMRCDTILYQCHTDKSPSQGNSDESREVP